jgi:hypothetical protein
MNKYQAVMAERVEKAKKRASEKKAQASSKRSTRIPKAVRLALYLAHKEAGTLRLYAQNKRILRA